MMSAASPSSDPLFLTEQSSLCSCSQLSDRIHSSLRGALLGCGHWNDLSLLIAAQPLWWVMSLQWGWDRWRLASCSAPAYTLPTLSIQAGSLIHWPLARRFVIAHYKGTDRRHLNCRATASPGITIKDLASAALFPNLFHLARVWEATAAARTPHSSKHHPPFSSIACFVSHRQGSEGLEIGWELSESWSIWFVNHFSISKWGPPAR